MELSQSWLLWEVNLGLHISSDKKENKKIDRIFWMLKRRELQNGTKTQTHTHAKCLMRTSVWLRSTRRLSSLVLTYSDCLKIPSLSTSLSYCKNIQKLTEHHRHRNVKYVHSSSDSLSFQFFLLHLVIGSKFKAAEWWQMHRNPSENGTFHSVKHNSLKYVKQ